MEEQLLAEVDGVYCWPGRKMKATLFSAKLGRLVLTSRRLVFLSTGGSDAGRRALKAAVVGPVGGMLGTSTGGLDASALRNPGSLEIPIGSLTRCESVKKALSISFTAADGSEKEFAFSQKIAMPGRDEWVARINSARAASA